MTAADILRERAANLDCHSEGMRATGCPSYERIIDGNDREADELRAVADLMDACWRRDECVCGAQPDEKCTPNCPLAALERLIEGDRDGA